MQIPKIQNNYTNYYKPNFKGFEFKNPQAQKVFEDKLEIAPKKAAKNIREYISETANEPNKIYIDSVNSLRLKRESTTKKSVLSALFESPLEPDYSSDTLFATFSNNNKALVVEKQNKSAPDTTRSVSAHLIRFIDRCSQAANYKPAFFEKFPKK